jgi:hypothetical protein
MNQKAKKQRLSLVAIIVLIAAASFTSCEKYSFNAPPVDPNQTLLFKTDIQPIFNSNCISCHGGSLSPDLRSGKSYNVLSRGGYVTLPGAASRLYVQLNSSSHLPKTTQTERSKVLYWINQGALNN